MVSKWCQLDWFIHDWLNTSSLLGSLLITRVTRLKNQCLAFRDLLSSGMIKVSQSKTRNWRRTVEYAPIPPTESSPSHNLNLQLFQPGFWEIQHEDSILNSTKEALSEHRLTVARLSLQKPCLCQLTLLVVDYKYFLSYFMRLYKFRTRRNLETLPPHFRNEVQRSKASCPTSSTIKQV